MRKSITSVPLISHGFREYRKVRPRVSFSILAPTQIEFESDTDSSDGQEMRKVTFNSRVSQFLSEKNRQEILKYHQRSANEEIESPVTVMDERVNELDSANEMLMDILEEIEAENISVEGCLRDAITLNLIGIDEARTVMDNFHLENSEMDANNNICYLPKEGNISETRHELMNKPTDKLLDLLSTFKTEDLTKCCRYTLGKLCQLTSIEDYQTAQKLAASTHKQSSNSHKLISRIPSYEDSTTSEITDDFFSEPTVISSGSSDSYEDSSGLGSELDFQCGTQLNSTALEVHRNDKCNATVTAVREALPTLIEGGVLKPKQAWRVIGSKDNDELLKKFTDEISLSLKSFRIGNPRKCEDKIKKSTLHKFELDCNNSYQDSGYCSYPSDRDSPTTSTSLFPMNFTNTNNSTKKRPFTIMSARSNSFKFTLRSSMPLANQHHRRIARRSSENDSLTCKDYAALISWCEKNELPSRTAYILHCNGCDSENDLLDLDVDNARYIQDLSWNTKTRLIVAIESLRLERYYEEMKEKLTRCSSVLKSIPP